jgi:lipoate-protein ligase A
MKWLYLDQKGVNPRWNLALEEYLLKEHRENFFYLWQNTSSVITGKHQNTWSEVNVSYCRAHDIIIARRLSGGGTVYHDENNLNFTFILNKSESDDLIDFDLCLTPIIQALNDLGVPAEKSERNDIFIEGKKVSGNAEHLDLRQKRVIHHGTLLFQSDLDKLRSAIKAEKVYESKAVKSVRSPVGNIVDYLKKPMSLPSFKQLMEQKVRAALGVEQLYQPDETAIRQINRLYEEKYNRSEWTFGYSPKFHFTREASQIQSRIEVNKGVYTRIDIEGENNWQSLCKALEGKAFGEEEVRNWLTLQELSEQEKETLLMILL